MKRARCPDSRRKTVRPDRSRTIVRVALSALIVMGWSTTLMAQTPVDLTEESGGMLDWAVALVLAAFVCAAGFWNPKRSHQN